ncbi:MAG: RHS repeat-associated core domain-containing protein, partial [bacterium]|nr:RHS repeat-associated core domain-containing protein [bacterium]
MDAWTLDSTTSFVYDGWNLIRETTTTDAGNSTDHYVWGLDLSGSLQGAGGPSTSLRTGIGGLLLQNTDSGSSLYVYDANGNVGQLVDAADGTLAAHYEYDPFSSKLPAASGPEADKNPFRFSTKYFDAETGLSYYGYQYYKPGLGRWMTQDPIGEQGGLNLYAYVRNSPIQLLDPLGLAAGECVTGLNECVVRKAKEYVGSTDIGDC